MKLQFEGKVIKIKEGKKTYICMYKDFLNCLAKAKSNFEDDYNELKNLNNLIDNYWDLIIIIESDGYRMINSLLDKYGKVSIPEDEFMNLSSEYSDKLFGPFLDELIEKYEEIIEEKERKIEAREIRKANRRQWYGLTREAQNRADIKNMQNLLWHNTRNVVGNAMSSGAASLKMGSVFADHQRMDRMKKAVESLFNEYWVWAYNTMENISDTPIQIITNEEKKQSDEALKKAQMSEIGSDENIESIKIALEANPDNIKVFEYMVENYGDSDCMVEKFASELQIDMTVWKNKKVEELIEKNKTDNLTNEAKILEAINTAEGYCRHFGVSSVKYKYINDLKDTWNKLDKILRTVEGIEYSSRDKSDAVKADIKYLKEYSLKNELTLSNIEEIKNQLILQLKSEEIKNTLDERLLKVQSYQELKNIQKASEEIIKCMPIYEKIQKNFLFGHIFSQSVYFGRFQEAFADNEKVAFAYDVSWINKGKNGLLLTNNGLYYYKKKDISFVRLEVFEGIEICQKKIKIYRKGEEDLCTELEVKIDQLEYGVFCEAFEDVIMLCKAIKNGNQEIADKDVYDNYNEKVPRSWNSEKKKIVIPIAVAGVLVITVLAVKSILSVENKMNLTNKATGIIKELDENEESSQTKKDSKISDNNNETIEAVENADPSIYEGRSGYDVDLEKSVNQTQDEENSIDYTMWTDTYLRVNGPAATISIWQADSKGVQFSVSIGGSGAAAYLDMRDMYAEWEDPVTVCYTEETGYELTINRRTDGNLEVYENYCYYEEGITLTGIYTYESEADLSVCEYIFPDSEGDTLTLEDCDGLTKLECKIARNEIYARHGRKFNDESLQMYFDACSWYNGTVEPENFTEDMLNEAELFNLHIINEYESIMGYKD